MKVAIPNQIHATKRIVDLPPIPLDRPEKQKLQKDAYITLKLRTSPADADSQTYDLTLVYFNSGSPEEWLRFRRDLRKVLVGQNITQGPPMYAMARRVLEGDALSRFNTVANDHGNETTANFALCLNDLTTHVFLQRALQKQKRFMRRKMCKPQNWTIRQYTNRMTELNEYLSSFPPFGADQALPEEEILDLLEFGIPRAWQNQFIIQGFDPQANSVNDFVQFCERLESTESTDSVSQATILRKRPRDVKSDKPSGSKKQKHGLKNFQGEIPTCLLHGPGHSTESRKVLQAQIRKMKSKYQSKDSSGESSSKPSSGKFYNKKELHTMVAREIKKALKSTSSQKSEVQQVDMQPQPEVEIPSSSSSSEKNPLAATTLLPLLVTSEVKGASSIRYINPVVRII